MANGSPRKGALIAGLVLIVIGFVFLLESWYEQFTFWRLIGRYWPVVLILIGVLKLHGYFTWRDSNPGQDAAAKE